LAVERPLRFCRADRLLHWSDFEIAMARALGELSTPASWLASIAWSRVLLGRLLQPSEMSTAHPSLLTGKLPVACWLSPTDPYSTPISLWLKLDAGSRDRVYDFPHALLVEGVRAARLCAPDRGDT
jgi:hypothetical protein